MPRRLYTVRLARWMTCICLALLTVTSGFAEGSGTGISRELARARAATVSDIRYHLHYELQPHSKVTWAEETLQFRLKASATPEPLALDFRDGTLSSLVLNGQPVPAEVVDGHIMLPAGLLAADNKVEAHFTARVDLAGSALTRYEDKEDGSEYIYSLFVPMDASMAFPCFDQPDLKGRFTLSITAPAAWKVITNTSGSVAAGNPGTLHWTFAETRPISTYLFAFAAGPWEKVHPTPGLPDVYVRRSQVKRAEPEVPELQTITAAGMAYLADYFHQPFPFPKYDMVLIPGFPFGGMEHAGATFLREDAVLFRQAPTASDRFGRDITTLHELTHQWFGDLVTMRWFNDLWLKEGFAQYMAYRAMDALHPETNPWKHFFEDIKPQAYGIDETEGTTPIFQDIPNLKDAKSAYGAIVYQKAPAILKQLEFRIGPEAFRKGLQIYLAQHAYANAEWSDLIGAFHTASGQDVQSWADAWVLRRGMPEVTAAFTCTGTQLATLTLHQHDVLPDNYTWPISTEILLGDSSSTTHPRKAGEQPRRASGHSREAGGSRGLQAPDSGLENERASAPGSPQPTTDLSSRPERSAAERPTSRTANASQPQTIPAAFTTPTFNVPVSANTACPAYIYANASDNAYGRFLLDPTSASYLAPQNATHAAQVPLAQTADPFLRSQLLTALWENVRKADFAPARYAQLALIDLDPEQDESISRILGGRVATTFHAYISPAGRSSLRSEAYRISRRRMLTAPTLGLRIVSFRTFVSLADTPAAQHDLADLLTGKLHIPGLELRPLDRWSMVSKLISSGSPLADAAFAAQARTDQSTDGLKYAWAVQAGRPDAKTKDRFFAAYALSPKDPSSKPEDWLTTSLRAFNAWNQEALTLRYLTPALDQLGEIKRDRKIFFLGAWLSAFLDGQTSQTALDAVHAWLAQPGIDPDLRRKVLENTEELERTVRIRTRFPD